MASVRTSHRFVPIRNHRTPRAQLETALSRYVLFTFDYIQTLKDFVNNSHRWERARNAEVDTMKQIKKRATQGSHDTDVEKLSASLSSVRRGLWEMQGFLDAVEKLSVTPVHLFKDNNPGYFLRGTADLESVRAIITIAQMIAPALICFKRNNEAFFQPKLENLEVLLLQLRNYIDIVQNICEGWRLSSLTDLSLNGPEVEVRRNLTDAEVRKMLAHITAIDDIRLDEDFRMVFLFRGRERPFMTQFPKLQPEMRRFLCELEACADRFDHMNKSANVAGVVNSSVGIASGTMSILGLVFAPFTAGLSLGLTAVGTGLGVASGVSSLATSATEIGVNKTQAKKAEENFTKFIEDSNKIERHLDEVVEQYFDDLHRSSLHKGELMIGKGVGIANGVRNSVKHFKKIKAFRAGKLAAGAVGEGILLAGKAGRAVSGALSAFFIGLDIYSVVSHSNALKGGCETPISKWIRARVALWRVEVDSWQRVWNSLHRGNAKKKDFLKMAF